ncbi:MAG: Hsp20/alpha crystallin family protein [Cyanobacteria bacterium J06621_8]
MNIIHYSPWQEMKSLQHQLDRLFDNALTSENWSDFGNRSNYPAAEITETDKAYHLKLEVPGVEVKDLDIQVMADKVAIAGERKSEVKSDEHGRTRSEFHYGKFQRVIPLPARIKNAEAKAEYKDGILNLTLPKHEAEKNKVIKVEINTANS